MVLAALARLASGRSATPTPRVSRSRFLARVNSATAAVMVTIESLDVKRLRSAPYSKARDPAADVGTGTSTASRETRQQTQTAIAAEAGGIPELPHGGVSGI
jgi:hypothetical protein